MAWGALNPIGGTPAASPVFPNHPVQSISSVVMLAALQAIQHSIGCALAGHHASKSLILSKVLC